MSFRVNNSVLAPGSYEVSVAGSSGIEIIYLRNLDSNRSVAVLSGPKSDTPKEWKKDGTPKLSFVCVAGSCSLSRLWNGEAPYAFHFNTPDERNVEARGGTVVTLALIKVR